MLRLALAVVVVLVGRAVTQDRPSPWPSVSGVYPHLAVFNSQPECGIGAVAPWAGKLWLVTYSPHRPKGSDDGLYEIDRNLVIKRRPESVGGTPANRMVHIESGQLLIGPHLIGRDGTVRTIPPKVMPGRLTANARHLETPDKKVYYLTMEEGLYEVDVKSLDVRTLLPDANARRPADSPHLPGYHGKGGYTGQGRLLYANNGEHGSWRHPLSRDPSGCLASWNGRTWSVVARAQFCEITGPGSLSGAVSDSDPVWVTGWDHRSVLLKLLDKGSWRTFRLPKASHTYDGRHGWHTEWPRIRPVDEDTWLMTMHGTLFAFPAGFRSGNTAGIRPRSTYLKMITDWAPWGDRIAFACNDASRFDNALCGQAQSNLWFVDSDRLDDLGPKQGCGGPWVDDEVRPGVPSDPYLIAGYETCVIHLVHDRGAPVGFTAEIDPDGTGSWSTLSEIPVPETGYASFVVPRAVEAEWIRFKCDTACRATVYLHYGPGRYREGADPRGLGRVPGGPIRPRGKGLGTLHFVASDEGKTIGYYELGPDLKLVRKEDPTAQAWLEKNAAFGEKPVEIDRSSVIVKDGSGRVFRLPRSPASNVGRRGRARREVVTERSLLIVQDVIYELPRENSGGVSRIKPLCSNARHVSDLCSWRGLLVMSGLDGSRGTARMVRSDDGRARLWLGTVDDLWMLGGPRGKGGPWNRTPVKAGVPSDPYLMYGYASKRLSIHQHAAATAPVNVTIEVDPVGDGRFCAYKTLSVDGRGHVETFEFPEGYSARWVRFVCDADAVLTTDLVYEPY